MGELAEVFKRGSIIGAGRCLSSSFGERKPSDLLQPSIDSNVGTPKVPRSTFKGNSLESTSVVTREPNIVALIVPRSNSKIFIRVVESVMILMVYLSTVPMKKAKKISRHVNVAARSIRIAFSAFSVKALGQGTPPSLPVKAHCILKSVCAYFGNLALCEGNVTNRLILRLNNRLAHNATFGHESTSNGLAVFGRILIITLGLVVATPAFAQLDALQGFCTTGGKNVVTSGLQSATAVQQSYPRCTVSVFLTGTLTHATIYKDAIGTPLGSVFTANSDGSWLFFIASGTGVDVTLSGGTAPNIFPTPFTLTDLKSGGGGGGGGITALTGDVTAAGSGSVAATLATVNSVPGSCGDATHVCQVTTNGKGLTTAQTPVAITAGGTGTVTHTAGALTALHEIVGNGGADVKADTGCSTDGAGNQTCASYAANGAGPSQTAYTYNSTPIVPGSSTTAVVGVNSSGQGVLSEAGGAAARICDATNGVCSGGGSSVGTVGQVQQVGSTAGSFFANVATTPAASFTAYKHMIFSDTTTAHCVSGQFAYYAGLPSFCNLNAFNDAIGTGSSVGQTGDAHIASVWGSGTSGGAESTGAAASTYSTEFANSGNDSTITIYADSHGSGDKQGAFDIYNADHGGPLFSSDQGNQSIVAITGEVNYATLTLATATGNPGPTTVTFNSANCPANNSFPSARCMPSPNAIIANVSQTPVAVGRLTGPSAALGGSIGTCATWVQQFPTSATLPVATAYGCATGLSINPPGPADQPTPVTVTLTVGSGLFTTGFVCSVGNRFIEPTVITAVSGSAGAQTITLNLGEPANGLFLIQGEACDLLSFDGDILYGNSNLGIQATTGNWYLGSIDGTHALYGNTLFGGGGTFAEPQASEPEKAIANPACAISTVYTVGQSCYDATTNCGGSGCVEQVTTAGTTGSSIATWNAGGYYSGYGNSTTQGTAVFTNLGNITGIHIYPAAVVLADYGIPATGYAANSNQFVYGSSLLSPSNSMRFTGGDTYVNPNVNVQLHNGINFSMQCLSPASPDGNGCTVFSASLQGAGVGAGGYGMSFIDSNPRPMQINSVSGAPTGVGIPGSVLQQGGLWGNFMIGDTAPEYCLFCYANNFPGATGTTLVNIPGEPELSNTTNGFMVGGSETVSNDLSVGGVATAQAGVITMQNGFTTTIQGELGFPFPNPPFSGLPVDYFGLCDGNAGDGNQTLCASTVARHNYGDLLTPNIPIAAANFSVPSNGVFYFGNSTTSAVTATGILSSPSAGNFSFDTTAPGNGLGNVVLHNINISGTCTGCGGGGAFSSITGGTNTTAAMLVGSGASLAPTGTGAVTANTLAAITTVLPSSGAINGTINFGPNYGLTALCLYVASGSNCDDGTGHNYGWGLEAGDYQSYVQKDSFGTAQFSWNNGGNLQTGASYDLMQLDKNSLRLVAGSVFGWGSTISSLDTGLSRDSAGVVDVGNGTAGNASGAMKMANLTDSTLTPGNCVQAGTGGLLGSGGTGNCVTLGGTPTVVAGSGAGTSPTVAVGGGQDVSFIVTLTTGTSPASGVLFTVTYSTNRGHNSFCTYSPGTSATAALTGSQTIYLQGSSSTSFTANVGAALTASTAYSWQFVCP